MSNWFYDHLIGAYRSAKNIQLPFKDVLSLRLTQIVKFKTRVQDATSALLRNSISLSKWTERVAEILRQGSIQAYILGKGGEHSMRISDYGFIGSHLQSEYAYLNQFAEQISAGLLTAGAIEARTNLYVNAFNVAYYLGRQLIHVEDSFKFEENVLADAENCVGCRRQAALGVVPIGTLSSIGTRNCKSNDLCHFRYYKERPKDFLLQPQKFGFL